MKRRYISNEEAINDILRFVEEGDEDLHYEDNLGELYSDEQSDFQLIPGILIKVYCYCFAYVDCYFYKEFLSVKFYFFRPC